MPYFVYLIVSKLKNKKRPSYVRYSKEWKKRLKWHNSGKGAKVKRGKKWNVVYYEEYNTKSDAMKNEYKLKKNYKLRNEIMNKWRFQFYYL